MYEDILNQQPYGIATFSKDGKYIYSNDEELKLRNITKNDIKSKNIFDLHNSEDALVLKTIFHDIQDPINKELFFEYQENAEYFQMRVVTDKDGVILSTLKNITNEKRMQLEILENKEDIKRLDDAVRGANIGFWDFFPQEGRILANETWVTQKKYKDEDFRVDKALFSEVKDGLNKWASIVHPDDLEATGALIELHLNGETEIYEAEFRMKCADGTYMWVYDLGRVFQRDEDGNAIRMNGVHIDITKIKELQQEIELEKNKAEQATKAKSQFLANMSHEIRTPMNGIMGMSHLALNTKLNDKQKNYIQKIDNSAKNLLGIINDILDFSKIEAGKLSIEKVEFDMFNVVESVINLIEFTAHEKNLEIIVSYGDKIGKNFFGDPLRLSQIITNLMSNAVKFTNEGEVGLFIKKVSQDKFSFEIIDTGIGLSDDEQEKLFKPFSQVDASTTREYGGTGLGLTISKQLVELMDGNISVESVIGEGSKFTFEIELKELAKNENRYNLFSNKKVLVVDDNKTWHEILTTLLNTFGLSVDVACSGQQALEILDKCHNKYDIILMDWNMPNIDGIETTKLINESCMFEKPPTVIMVSSFRQESIMNMAKDVGIDIFLQKPINPSLLNDVLNDVFKGEIKMNNSYPQTINSIKADINCLVDSNILLVEDNKINQEIIIGLLENSGINIDVVSNGQDAVDKFKKNLNKYELILMDLQMPIMDGYEATKNIRLINKNIPIIAITANAMKEDVQKTKKAGMNEHLNKPIEVEKLYSILLEYISKKVEVEEFESATANDLIIPDFVHINRSIGLKYSNNNKKLYLKILQNFYSDFHDLSIERLNQEEFKRFIHTLKGLSANIGAIDLNLIIKQFEKTENKSLLNLLLNKLFLVIDELKDIGKISNKKLLVLHSTLRNQLFLDLKEAVNTKRIKKCEPIFQKIEKYKLSNVDQQLFDCVKNDVEEYKFKSAIQILNKEI